MLIDTYTAEPTETQQLYRRAKAEQWNPDADIDWAREHVYEEFVDPEVGLFFNRAFVSQMFYGEQAALDVACALVPAAPDLDSKLCLALQAADESRHVEVFGRYCADLGGVWPLSDPLREMLDSIAQAPEVEEKIVGMHLFVEGIALEAFRTKLKQTSDPVLKDILRLVARDEARHAEFGLLFLRRHPPAESPALRSHLEERVAAWWRLWEHAMRYRDDVVWPSVPKLARRLFNRQTVGNLEDARVDLEVRLRKLGLQLRTD